MGWPQEAGKTSGMHVPRTGEGLGASESQGPTPSFHWRSHPLDDFPQHTASQFRSHHARRS